MPLYVLLLFNIFYQVFILHRVSFICEYTNEYVCNVSSPATEAVQINNNKNIRHYSKVIYDTFHLVCIWRVGGGVVNERFLCSVWRVGGGGGSGVVVNERFLCSVWRVGGGGRAGVVVNERFLCSVLHILTQAHTHALMDARKRICAQRGHTPTLHAMLTTI